MDLLSLGFIVLIVLTSGFVAWLGDKVGKKLGKKRLSLFGLRPRHTAQAGTILLGLIISVVTISLVSACSSDVRTWIIEGRRTIQDLKKTQVELLDAQNNLKNIQTKFEKDQKQITRLEDQIHQGSQRLASLDTTNKGLTDRQKALQGQLRITSAEVKMRDAQIRVTEQHVKLIRANLAENQRHLTQASKDLSFAVKERNRSLLQNKDLDDSNVKLAAQIEGQKNEVQDLEKQKSDLQQDLQQTQLNLGDLRKNLADETEKLTEAKQQLAKTNDDLDKVNSELTRVNDLTTRFVQSVFLQSRMYPLIYGVHQEVVRMAVPANLTETEARKELDELLAKARAEGVRRGAKGYKTKDKTYAVAEFYDRPDATAEQVKDLIVKGLTESPEEQVLIIYATMNVFKGEPVPLDADIRQNPVVYQKDQIVAESEINGQSSLGNIYQQLNAFVGVRLKNKAIQDHMIPLYSEDESFGSLSTDLVLELVNKVKSTGRTVRLQAMAQAETRAADPLNLEFRIQ